MDKYDISHIMTNLLIMFCVGAVCVAIFPLSTCTLKQAEMMHDVEVNCIKQPTCDITHFNVGTRQ